MAKKVFELMGGEQLFAGKVSGDCWKMPKFSINRQVSGKYYFTDKRIAFLASGLVGTESVSWEIEMKDIAQMVRLVFHEETEGFLVSSKVSICFEKLLKDFGYQEKPISSAEEGLLRMGSIIGSFFG